MYNKIRVIDFEVDFYRSFFCAAWHKPLAPASGPLFARQSAVNATTKNTYRNAQHIQYSASKTLCAI